MDTNNRTYSKTYHVEKTVKNFENEAWFFESGPFFRMGVGSNTIFLKGNPVFFGVFEFCSGNGNTFIANYNNPKRQ